MLKLTKGEKAIYIAVFVIFVLYSLYIVLPLAFCFNGSLKASGAEFMKNMISIPKKPKFENYWTALNTLELNRNSFFEMTLNSVLFAGGTTFFGIMSSTFLAYAISKYDFKLKNFLYSLALFVMIIPIYGSLPANYRLLKQLNFTNSWLYLISTAGGFGFNFIVIHSFFEGVSREYSEAAFIDGAGHFRVFFQIMLPMALPSITAIVITAFIGSWNAYMTPLLYLGKMPTLSSGLWAYNERMKYTANQPVYFAGVLISLIPIVVLFLAFQNTIMQKVYAGGLKG